MTAVGTEEKGGFLLRTPDENAVEQMATVIRGNPYSSPETSLLMVAPGQKNSKGEIIVHVGDILPEDIPKLRFVSQQSLETFATSPQFPVPLF